MTSPASSRSRGYCLGQYEVVEHIATGAMGAVYKALDTLKGGYVALKVLAPDFAKPVLLERFRREAKHGSKLRHKNIASIFELANAQDTYFLIMEYVDGENLHEHICQKGRLPADESRDITTQIARALEHAHQLGVIHRDIKPSNILLTKSDGRTVAKLIDFGLARVNNEDEYRLTRDGTTVGTVNYLPPEQARDSGAADIRSDIYALGCTLYHMLAGEPPFPEGSLSERLYNMPRPNPPICGRSFPTNCGPSASACWPKNLKTAIKRRRSC